MYNSKSLNYFKQSKDAQSKEIETASILVDSMDRVKEELLPHLQDIERLVVAPAGEYLTVFDAIKKYILKRSHKLLDYDRYRDIVKKLKEKPDRTSADEKKLSSMETALDEATREYNNYNNLLKNELPIFLELRIQFIDPCFATFYQCQVRVYHILYEEFKRLAHDRFDMKCSAINGFNSKYEDAAALFDQLTIPRRRTAGKSDVPNASPASSAVTGSPLDNFNGSNTSLHGGSPALSHKTSPGFSAISPKPSSLSPAAAAATGMAIGAAANQPPPYSAPLKLPSPALEKNQPPKQHVVALYDYEATAEGDLSFKRNDRIEVVEKTDNQNDWWTGRLNGATGQFPGNYVTLV